MYKRTNKLISDGSILDTFGAKDVQISTTAGIYKETDRRQRNNEEDCVLVESQRSVGNVFQERDINPDGIFLISGGLGGLGLLVAKVLCQLGVKYIALLSRTGEVSYDGQGMDVALDSLLNSYSAEVRVVKCDVSSETSLVTALRGLRLTCGSDIIGVFHCAGVLCDGLIRGGKAINGRETVWNSKARSGFLLHTHTLRDPIQVFVCFSSIVVALGNIGQSIYAAANAYLDKIALLRVKHDLPGKSIRWALVSGMGMGVPIASSSVQREDFAAFPLCLAAVEAILLENMTVSDYYLSPKAFAATIISQSSIIVSVC